MRLVVWGCVVMKGVQGSDEIIPEWALMAGQLGPHRANGYEYNLCNGGVAMTSSICDISEYN